MTMFEKQIRGQISEAKAISKLLERDYRVFTPFGDGSRIDIVGHRDGTWSRFQVKTAWAYEQGLMFETRSRSGNAGQRTTLTYTDEDVDFFLVYFPDNDSVYCIPISEVTAGGTMRLRIKPAKRQLRKIKWAKDYLV